MPFLKTLLKGLFRVLLFFFLLFITLGILIQIPYIQNKFVNIFSTKVSKTLGTEVNVDNVSIDFLSRVNINGILIKDYKGDTLAFVQSLQNKHVLDYAINEPFEIIGESLKLDGLYLYLDNTRTDSTFNITKTFRKNSANSNLSSSKKESISLDFIHLGGIEIGNVNFVLRDKFNYQTISFKIDKVKIDAKDLELNSIVKKISRLEIQKPIVSLVHHAAPYREKEYNPEYLSIPFDLDVNELILKDGVLKVIDEPITNTETNKLVSFKDLDVQNIQIKSTNVILRNRFIKAKVESLAANEKSGLRIVDLEADFFLNSFRTEAKNLRFRSNNSKLNGHLKFEYKHMREYLRFAAWVNVKANMRHSNLSIKDLAYFTENLKPWKHLDVAFTANARGIMNDLSLNNLKASLNKNKLKVNGSMRVMDLFSGKGLNTIANLDNVHFDKNDIEYFFQKPGLPPELDRLGRISYDGSFEGNPIKFKLNGDLTTKLGSANLKETSFDFHNLEKSKYKGDVKLNNVQLNNILSDGSAIDNISANLFVDGEGFTISSLKSYLKGEVNSLDINKVTYSNFKVDGNIADKVFQGKIISEDPSLLFKANGIVSMKEDLPNLELNVELKDVDLQKLGYSRKKLHLFTEVYGIGRGNNIDEMLGSMLLKNLYLLDKSDDNKRYDFSNLTFEKDLFDGRTDKYINILSNEINASLIGQYKVSDVTSILKDYFIDYLVVDKQESFRSYSNTYFNLNLELENVRSYARLIHPELKNIESGKIKLRFNGLENSLKLTGKLHNTDYLGFHFPNISMTNNSSNDDLQTNLEIDSVFFNNKLAVTPLKAKLSQLKEGLDLSLELLNRTDDKFVDFNCMIKKELDDYVFHIKPFISYYGRKVWSLNPDNIVKLNPNEKTLEISDLEFFKGKQKIEIENQKNSSYSLVAGFESVKLEELISGFLPSLKTFKGVLNGNLVIANVLKKPTPIANVSIDNITWDKEEIGDLSLISTFSNQDLNSKVKIKGKLYDIVSNVYFNSRVGIDSLYSNTKINKFKPNILNKVLNNLVYEMDGEVHGDIAIYGNIKKLQARGMLYVDTLSTYLNTIHTRYHTKNQKIAIEPNKIRLTDFLFKDEEGNTGLGNGYIAYNNFRHFDLFLNTSSRKLLCLNTNSSHNKIFYGKVYMDANAQFTGTIGDRITISAQGKNLTKSRLTIGFESNQRTDKYGFFEFISKDSSSKQASKTTTTRKIQTGGVNLDFDFDINKFGKLYIVMDPGLDDKIECNGDGKIALKLSPETDIDIKGSYVINSGTYLFTYQNIVQRLFYLNNGGRMTFVGDPMASLIDASATFTTRASAEELINAYFGNTNDSRVLSAAKSNVKVSILLKLKDRITQPRISYAIDNIEQNSPEVRSAFESITSTTRNNEAELNKQVMGLLVLQRFFPPTFTGFNNQNSNNTVGSDLRNTFFDVVTGKLSGYVTDWMQNTFRGMNFGLTYKNYNQLNTTDQLSNTRNELQVAVSQKLLNDRLIFNVGGNYDFGQSQFSNTNTSFFGGDIDLEYRLTPLGNVRAKFYSNLSNDPLNSVYFMKTGVGILFQKEFDGFNQLFKKKKFK